MCNRFACAGVLTFMGIRAGALATKRPRMRTVSIEVFEVTIVLSGCYYVLHSPAQVAEERHNQG